MALKRFLLAGLAALALSAPAAHAALPAPGSLDRSFGRGGIASWSDPFLDLDPILFATQPDGRLLLGARANVPGSTAGPGAVVSRFSANGALDASYGDGGRVETGLGYPHLAADADGGLAAAEVTGTSDHPALTVLRYDHQGQPLAAFGGGRVEVPIDSDTSYYGVSALTAQPDGAVIVVFFNGTVYRFTPAGVLDTSFGGGTGRIVLAHPPERVEVSAVVVRPDGRILLGGTVVPKDTADGYALLAQLLPDGRLDQSFGGAGSGYLVELSPDARRVAVLALRPGGRIVAGGSACAHLICRLFLWRLPPNGGSELARGHTIFHNLTALDSVSGLALDSRGGIVVLGSGSGLRTFDSFLLRFDSGGRQDRGFPLVYWRNRHSAIGPLLTRNGRIVVAWREPRKHDTGIDHITRIWGGYDRSKPVIRVKLSCASGRPAARVSVRDRSALRHLRVFLDRERLRPRNRHDFTLRLHPGRLDIQAVDMAGNTGERHLRVRRCVSG